MGFFQDLFGGAGGGGFYNPAIFNQRAQQIQDFQNNLTQARQRYLNNYQNFQSNQFLTQLMPDMAAQFAGRGLQMNGGAYSAELARQAAGMQGQALNTAYSAENQDLNSVNNAQADLFGQQLGVYNASAQTVANNTMQRRLAMQNAIGGLAGQAAGSAFNHYLPPTVNYNYSGLTSGGVAS